MSFEAALDQVGPPVWMRDELVEIGMVESDEGGRFEVVPAADSSEGYRDMEDFVETVSDARLRDRLWSALSGQRPFRRFKDALEATQVERDRWFAFSAARTRDRIIQWLREEGIEPILK